MCNSQSHDHLNDDLSDLDGFFGDFDLGAVRDTTGDIPTSIPTPTFTENCKSCGGSGRFVSWAGRVVGNCHQCKGAGKQTFKTSPTARAATQKSYANRKAAAATAAVESAEAFTTQHPIAVEWLRASNSNFAASLLEALTKYGHLTENQVNAVYRIIAKNDAEKAEKIAAAAKRAENAPEITVARIEQAFQHAQDRGVKRPKLRLDTFKFSLAPVTGRNAGSIYVTENEQYLGKITDGKFFRVRECNDEQEARIVAAAADPSTAATAYGQRTGQCSICARELTNSESINRAIGPICAEKYGF